MTDFQIRYSCEEGKDDAEAAYEWMFEAVLDNCEPDQVTFSVVDSCNPPSLALWRDRVFSEVIAASPL